MTEANPSPALPKMKELRSVGIKTYKAAHNAGSGRCADDGKEHITHDQSVVRPPIPRPSPHGRHEVPPLGLHLNLYIPMNRKKRLPTHLFI